MREILKRAAAVALATCWAGPAAAQEEESKDPPVSIGASYVTDVLADVDGGRERGFAWLGRADVTARIDGSVLKLDGAEFFLDALVTHTGSFSSSRVGDIQTVSNVQGDGIPRLFEAWGEVPVTARLRLKAGLIDLNTEFDVQSVGALFINSSHGIGPDFSQSGRNGPSIFPVTSGAVIVRYENAGWAARVGVFDAVSGDPERPGRFVARFPGTRGALIVGEVDKRIGAAKVQVGAWRYTPRFDAIDPTRPRAMSQGAYALAETRFAREVDAWVRIGIADRRTNSIAFYIGGGIARGPESSRLGLAVAHAQAGEPARRLGLGVPGERAETAVELTWARRVVKGLVMQPNIQYVVNPGWDPSTRDALVVGTRMRIAIGR